MAYASKNTKIFVSVIVVSIVVVTLIALLLNLNRPTFTSSQAASCQEGSVDYCIDNDTQLLCRGGKEFTNDCMTGYSCIGGVCQRYASGSLPGNE